MNASVAALTRLGATAALMPMPAGATTVGCIDGMWAMDEFGSYLPQSDLTQIAFDDGFKTTQEFAAFFEQRIKAGVLKWLLIKWEVAE